MSIKQKLYNYKLKINSKKDRSTAIHSTPVSILLLFILILFILCSEEYEENITLGIVRELLQISYGVILGIFRYFKY